MPSGPRSEAERSVGVPRAPRFEREFIVDDIVVCGWPLNPDLDGLGIPPCLLAEGRQHRGRLLEQCCEQFSSLPQV